MNEESFIDSLTNVIYYNINNSVHLQDSFKSELIDSIRKIKEEDSDENHKIKKINDYWEEIKKNDKLIEEKKVIIDELTLSEKICSLFNFTKWKIINNKNSESVRLRVAEVIDNINKESLAKEVETIYNKYGCWCFNYTNELKKIECCLPYILGLPASEQQSDKVYSDIKKTPALPNKDEFYVVVLNNQLNVRRPHVLDLDIRSCYHLWQPNGVTKPRVNNSENCKNSDGVKEFILQRNQSLIVNRLENLIKAC